MKDGQLTIPANDAIFRVSYYLSHMNTSDDVYIPYYPLSSLVNVYNLVDYRNDIVILHDGTVSSRLRGLTHVDHLMQCVKLCSLLGIYEETFQSMMVRAQFITYIDCLQRSMRILYAMYYSGYKSTALHYSSMIYLDHNVFSAPSYTKFKQRFRSYYRGMFWVRRYIARSCRCSFCTSILHATFLRNDPYYEENTVFRAWPDFSGIVNQSQHSLPL